MTGCIHCGEDIFYVGGYTCWVDMLQRDYCPDTESAHEPRRSRVLARTHQLRLFAQTNAERQGTLL